nr:hypothetical protein [uncultured Dysosmobacter sp.]
MPERTYTLQLTGTDLFIIRFELERVADEHDKSAEMTAELVAAGYGTVKDTAYWREQAANCRAVVAKAQAALDAGPGLGV